jgi:hypothetical protein
MRSAIAEHDLGTQADTVAHCVAAGLIALRCSRSEAWLASVGKEFKDLFGSGDAQWRDLQADALGIRCAQTATSDALLRDCCTRVDAPATHPRKSGAAAL